MSTQYWMIYPDKRWVSGQELIDGANDAIANNNLDDAPPTNPEEAMDILEDLGEITMTGETRRVFVHLCLECRAQQQEESNQ